MKSLFSTILADVKKFFGNLDTEAGKFCAWFVKLFKEVPTALQVVNNFINRLAPMVVAALSIVNPAEGAIVSEALSTVQTALAGLAAAANSAASGQSFLQDLKSFAAAIPATLTSLDVKDAALKSKIEDISTFITSECAVIIPAVESWVDSLAPSTSNPSSAA